MQREAAARLDAFTSAPPSGNTTGRVATFTPKGMRIPPIVIVRPRPS
jgi:hypothetical protein